MFRTLLVHITPRLALVAVASAGLLQPRISLGQAAKGDGALMNRTVISTELSPAFTAFSPAQIHDGSDPLEGEGALQGRVQTPPTSGHSDAALAAVDLIPVNGERALLGRWPVEKPVSNLAEDPGQTGPGADQALNWASQ
jgi:hypothetical protein